MKQLDTTHRGTKLLMRFWRTMTYHPDKDKVDELWGRYHYAFVLSKADRDSGSVKQFI